jgi:hypothetical protein
MTRGVRYFGIVTLTVATVVVVIFGAALIWYLNLPAQETYAPNDAQSRSRAAATEPLRHLLRDKVLTRILPNVTTYSPGYTEATFQAIALGTTMEQVKLALGDPPYRGPASGGGEIWLYSEQGDPSKDYLVRGIGFDKDGYVIEKLSDFTID